MPDKFKNPQDPHDPDKPDNFSGLPDDLDVLEAVKEEGEIEWDDGQEVNQVHRLLEKFPFPWRAQEANDVFLQIGKLLQCGPN